MRCDRIAYAKLTPILRGTYAAQTSLTPRCPGPLSARLSLDRVTRGYFARSTSRREGPSGRMGADNAGLWCPPQEARVARGAHPERAARVAWGRGMWALAWASGARLRPVIATAIASNCHPRQMNDRNGTSDGSPGIAPPCTLPGLPPRPPQGAPCGAVHSNVDEPGLSARGLFGALRGHVARLVNYYPLKEGNWEGALKGLFLANASRENAFLDKTSWTHWGLNPGPPAC